MRFGYYFNDGTPGNKKKIRGFGLKPGLMRDISFLGYSAVFNGYRNVLPELAGFTYRAFGVIWFGKIYCSFVNVEDIADKARKFLLKDPERFKNALSGAISIFKNVRDDFAEIEKRGLDTESLFRLLDVYEKYYGSLGVYNVLMRTITGTGSRLKIRKDIVKRVGRERNEIAALYPKIENFLKVYIRNIGREFKIDGSLILNMTMAEVRSRLKSRVFPKRFLNEVRKRAGHCFYLYDFTRDEERIISDARKVRSIYEDFFGLKGKTDLIKGVCAYPGKVSAKAAILPYNPDPSDFKFEKGRVIVAVHTNPHFLPVIRRSSAIIADEGGILSHAAVISRELKKPCIVGARIATKVLKDGDLVEADAEGGIVQTEPVAGVYKTHRDIPFLCIAYFFMF